MPPTTSVRRPTDAVAQLLGTLWDDALDPGYAAAAARRPEAAQSGHPARSARSGRSGGGVLLGAVALALVGLLLAVAVVQTHAARPAVAQRRADLLSRVKQQTSRYDAMTSAVADLQAELSRLKQRALSTTSQGAAVAAEVDRLEQVTGQQPVAGPGVRITVDDAPTPPPGTDPSLDRVLDRDLQSVVNGLWAAGAEAVAVGGQRLTATSAIRAAGDAILVDYRPLERPYVVTAIGDPQTLESRFVAGPAGAALRTLQSTYGIVYSIDSADRLTLPAAAAAGLRYARAEGAQR
jgi:uncharacterized protein YlxW (UPF0749 family)